MPIKFKVVERGEPGVTGGGVHKYYASPVMSGELDLDQLTKMIEKISTVSGADIRAVLYALVDVSVDQLSNGQIIRLGELGSLRISLSSEGKDRPEDVSSLSVKKSSVLFTPGKRIKEMLIIAKYQKE